MLCYVKQETICNLFVIWDLLAGQFSYSAELSMKKSFITSGPDIVKHKSFFKHKYFFLLYFEYNAKQKNFFLKDSEAQ